jgi:plastocyanin
MKFMKTLVITVFFSAMVNIHANTINVSALAMSFAPDTISAAVGDTINWVWTGGIHTTTSTTIPTGALTWNAALDLTHTSFRYVISIPGTYNYQCNLHFLLGMVGVIQASPIGIEPVSSNVPGKYELYQNFPNPFNPSTTIQFDIAERVPVDISIYDMRGAKIATLVSEQLSAGSYKVTWDGSSGPSGAYFIRFSAGSFTQTKKMVLIK